MDHYCGFDEDGRWFRYRAGAIILHGGFVLMARNDAEPYFYSIGGGVHHMETAEAAVRREVREEIGIPHLLRNRTQPAGRTAEVDHDEGVSRRSSSVAAS